MHRTNRPLPDALGEYGEISAPDSMVGCFWSLILTVVAFVTIGLLVAGIVHYLLNWAVGRGTGMLDGMTFGQVITTIYNVVLVRIVLVLLLGNVIVGIAESLKNQHFQLAMTGDWLLTRALPYVLCAGVMQMVVLTVPVEYSGLSTAASDAIWAFVILSLLGHILDALKDIGLPIPQALGDAPKAKATPSP